MIPPMPRGGGSSAPRMPLTAANQGGLDSPVMANRQAHRFVPSLCLAVAILAGGAAGCTRGRYYTQADREVSTLLAEKSCDPRWAVPVNYNVRQDERSRFYDVYNQILPPMPPDDPTSHRYMHCVDGKKGWQQWHNNGDRTTLDNPEWRARIAEVVEITDGGAIKLTLESAIRLAYLNSLDWQDQLETLYLSALDVSTERFRFDVQLLSGGAYPGTNTTTYSNRGPLNAAGASTAWATRTGVTARRYFASAGTMVVGVVNSIMWQFAGPDKYTNVSLVNFNFVQPLLQRAGRSVALEPLTIVERALLANLRTLQFYRQGFFLQVAFGAGTPQQLQRRGGFFGGTGFTGFTGTGVGGFGNIGGVFFGGNGVGLQVGGGGTGGAGFAGGGAGNVGGFFGLLQLRQQIRNAEQNLFAQERALALLDANLEAGLVGLDQVDQLRQSVETGRAGLLQAKTSLTNQIESYKVNVLCLPSDTAVALDESFIKPFQFISPELQKLQNDFGDFLATWSFGDEENLKEIDDPRVDEALRDAEEIKAPVAKGAATDDDDPGDRPTAAGDEPAEDAVAKDNPEKENDGAGTKDSVKADAETEAEEGDVDEKLVSESVARLADLRKRVEEQSKAVSADLALARTNAAGRLAGMRPNERDTFVREMKLLDDDLGKLVERARRAEAEMERLRDQITPENLRETSDKFVKLVNDVSGAVDEMSLIQARARIEAVTMDVEPLDPDVAFEIARANRLDWMNNRAALVDQWRLIQFNAMSLLAGLDIVVDGGLNTVGNNPAKFQTPTGTMSAGVQFDAPFTRLTERNNFRQAILDYQQVRRQQIQYEDRIKLALRQSLRQLDLDKRNLETQRRALIIAIRRVDQTRLTLSQPAPPLPAPGPTGIVDVTAGQLGPTATLNLIFAYNDLRSTQDAFTSIWINYFATRASLAQQLGVMQLTDEGAWVDAPFACAERATEDELPLPPAVPEEWLKHLEEMDAPKAVPAKEMVRGVKAPGAAETLPAPPAPRPNVEAEPIPSPPGDEAQAPEAPAAPASATVTGALKIPGSVGARTSSAAARIAKGWRAQKAESAPKRIE